MSSIDSSQSDSLIIPEEEYITEIWDGDTHRDYTPSLPVVGTVVFYVLLIVAFAAFLQFWIYKKQGTLWATLFKNLLYLLGCGLLMFAFSVIPGYQENKGYLLYLAVFGFSFGSFFASYFIATHHFYKYKKFTRALFVKILLALGVFQVLTLLISIYRSY